MKTASFPSATGAASSMLSPGIGSAAIVPLPLASSSVARDGFRSSTSKFSLGSDIESTSTGTWMVFVVSRGSKRSVPEVVV